MCKLCDTPPVLDRIERQIKALDGGGNLNPDAIRNLPAEAGALLTALYNAHQASRLILTTDATMEVIDLTGAGNPGVMH